jgi:glyoxylase-like metal-dependent hydrolase (beta-lactamase superfamily II)
MAGTLESLGDGAGAWIQQPGGQGTTNAGVVIEDDGITLIDTLMVRSQWEPFGDAVDALALPIPRVVLTSSHVEFVGGTGRFWMAGRYGRRQTSVHLDQPPNIEGLRRLYPAFAGEFRDDFATRPVTHTVEEAAWLTPLVLAIPVAGEQAENLVVQVPSANVVFAGAMATFGATPNCFDGSPEVWADTLGDMAGWGQIIVPGIGPVGGPNDVLALQAYLYACCEAEGDPTAIPEGPWDDWTDRDLDEVNVERAASLASGVDEVPQSMRRRLGLG